MNLKPFPAVTGQTDLKDWARQVSQIRGLDQREAKLLAGRFVRGRLRTDRGVPANAGDIADSDAEFDWIVTAAFLYVCVNSAGALKWGRVALNTSW